MVFFDFENLRKCWQWFAKLPFGYKVVVGCSRCGDCSCVVLFRVWAGAQA